MMFIIKVFLDPMVQLLVWGTLTTITFVYTLIRAFDGSADDDLYRYWRIVASGLISLFWTAGAFMWFAACMEWMIISDTVLTTIFFIMYRHTRAPWLRSLVILGLVFIELDLLLMSGFPQIAFAVLSNIVFGRQLYKVSGKKRIEQKIIV